MSEKSSISELRLNKRQADKIAKDLYGPTAAASPQPGQKDRNQRFGIMYVEPAGLGSNAYLMCLGYGSSYGAALDMAAKNPVGVMAANRWKTIQEHWEEFGKNPESVLQKFREDFDKLSKLKEQNND